MPSHAQKRPSSKRKQFAVWSVLVVRTVRSSNHCGRVESFHVSTHAKVDFRNAGSFPARSATTAAAFAKRLA